MAEAARAEIKTFLAAQSREDVEWGFVALAEVLASAPVLVIGPGPTLEARVLAELACSMARERRE